LILAPGWLSQQDEDRCRVTVALAARSDSAVSVAACSVSPSPAADVQSGPWVAGSSPSVIGTQASVPSIESSKKKRLLTTGSTKPRWRCACAETSGA
jgi:hypothetical protein